MSIHKIKDIEKAISEKKLLIKETKSSLVELEKKMRTASEILHYAEIYKDNLRYHNAMLRSKDPDRYYREHNTKLTLFYAAEHVLNDKFGIIPSKMNYHTMTDGYSLMEDKNTLIKPVHRIIHPTHRFIVYSFLKRLYFVFCEDIYQKVGDCYGGR